jgi:hypothetical protein
MLNGSTIGKLITDICDITTGYSNIRGDGNLGMAIIGAAISEHADAMNRIASALERQNQISQYVANKSPADAESGINAQIWFTTAEQRQKRIEELQTENAKLKLSCLNCVHFHDTDECIYQDGYKSTSCPCKDCLDKSNWTAKESK